MLCKLNKFLISRAIDNGEGPGRRLITHMNHCEKCAAYYQSIKLIDARLKQTAYDTDEPLRDLNSRIMDALPRRKEADTAATVSLMDLIKSLVSAPKLAMLAACIIVIAGVFFQINQSRKMERYADALDAIEYFDAYNKALLAFISNEDESSLELIAEDPYAKEMDNLTADATKMVTFLVSCVDVGLSEPSLDSSGL